MARYVALLRAINVGGNRCVPMTLLRALFVTAGASEVATYIQSGNVVFTHAARSPQKLALELERAIAKATGFEVPVILRTAAELAAVVADNPFPPTESDRLYVWFLPATLAAGVLTGIAVEAFAPERFALRGRELYLCLPSGVGKSKLTVALGRVKPVAAATGRNWRTVQKLVELAGKAKATA